MRDLLAIHTTAGCRHRSAGAASVALALLALGGCGGSPAVRPPTLPIEVPDVWQDTAASTDSAATWWASFPDPRLRDIVAEALANNPNLTAASARLEGAAAAARIAGAAVFPLLNVAGSASRRQQVFVGLPIPSASGPLTNTSESYGVSLDASWEADLWGRNRAVRSAAIADAEAAHADWEGARLSLAAQALKAAFACHEAERQLALAEETLASHARTVARIERRYRRGLVPALDLHLATAERDGATAAVAARQAALEGTQRSLELILGRYPGAELRIEEDLAPALPVVPAGLPANLLLRRPDLVAAERRWAAAGRRTYEAKANLLPRISLTASGGRSAEALSDLLDHDFSVWSLAASLLQPLFQGGRLRAGVQAAAAGERAAEADWVATALRAFAEVETALASERHLARQEEAQERAAGHAAAAAVDARARYETGLLDVISWLTAERAAFAAEGHRLDARRRRLSARVDLHLALGGGFTLPEETP